MAPLWLGAPGFKPRVLLYSTIGYSSDILNRYRRYSPDQQVMSPTLSALVTDAQCRGFDPLDHTGVRLLHIDTCPMISVEVVKAHCVQTGLVSREFDSRTCRVGDALSASDNRTCVQSQLTGGGVVIRDHVVLGPLSRGYPGVDYPPP